MSGQFPKSKNLAEFWDNLAHGADCISEIPTKRWSIDDYYDPDPKVPGKTYCKWMGILEDVDKFDPLFFGISPAEAEFMDPQQRLFLENCWLCIEDSGLSPSLLSGSSFGVFVGCSTGDYWNFINRQRLNAQGLIGGATSILSARISYVLNLKGPCLAIDTACSSSLVAIAEACNSLILQTSDLALAGGVSVLVGPSMHIMTSKAGMLSQDGRCFTFDTRANGFVPGEGVGVVLLKRLSDAVRDQDPIYGVIRGWGINQDGKTNGITAPSVNSQILLEKEIYQRFGINPETISLIEAHGTGTKLGDPIEVEALNESFQSYTRKKNYCALGSVKSNIGHLLTAAGVAGVIKVLLALHHRMLPPTINFEKINEHISLDNSPFYVNTELHPWEAASGIPRRAAVSSFGFSGTNAHLVIEEYLPKTDTAKTPILINTNNPILFVLSAKSEKQLKIYAECMKSFIESYKDLNLPNMAYTLQVGREAMDYRLVFLADSRETLLKALEGFIDNNSSSGVLTAQVKKSKDGVMVFEADEDAKNLLQTWVQKKKLRKIAELWVKGLNVDWNKLYGENKPRRISLPTYPFARERYWIPQIDTKAGSSTAAVSTPAALIHPLLHQNTSDLSEQRFSSTFTGQEFFLADHVVKGQRILPGVAYLEMARAAVDQAAGALKDGQTRIRLKNVVWVCPIAVEDQPVQVHIGLFPEDNGEIAYEIYSQSEVTSAEPVVHSQGSAVLSSFAEVPTLDLMALQTQCKQNTLTLNQCYEAFRSMGLDYGPGYQGIEKVYVGSGQILAKLSLPSSVLDTKNQFVLHPSLMDSALQASIGLMIMPSGSKVPLRPVLPFALQEIEIIGKCTSTMWALVRYSDGSKAGDQVEKLDIDLCDNQGNVCVQMKRLVCQGGSQSSIYRHSSQPVTVVGANFSNISDKPSRISLRPLSEAHVLLSKPIDKTQQSITLLSTSISLSQPIINDESEPNTYVQEAIFAESLLEELTTSLAEALNMKRSDVDVDKKFIDMGLDSIIGVEWIQAINIQYGTSITAAEVYNYPSIREFAGFLEKELNKNGEGLAQTPLKSTPSFIPPKQSTKLLSSGLPKKQRSLIQSSRRFWPCRLVPTALPKFPELIHLNMSSRGRPIFWFHGGVGEVGAYRAIAQKSHRPFYGIQPRGWMTNRSPLHGIQAMAAYYVHIIQTVQPEGPYDLGGYSLAGRLAYEVTRQLQELGQTVNTIVMLDSIFLDSPYSSESGKEYIAQKTLILQAVNRALLSTISQEPEKLTKTLIHREELNSEVEDETFFKQLIILAKARGLTIPETQFYNHIQQNVKVQHAYEIENFFVLPLSDPQSVICYYFRNKSGLFFGELEPYFTTKADEISFDHTNYWEGWEKQFPNFHMIDVDSSNHIMLLSEPKACETIISFCKNLYSEKGIATEFLNSFIKTYSSL